MRTFDDPHGRELDREPATEAPIPLSRRAAADTIATAIRRLVESAVAAPPSGVAVRPITVVGRPSGAEPSAQGARDGLPTRLHRRVTLDGALAHSGHTTHREPRRERSVHDATTLPAPPDDVLRAAPPRGPRPTPRPDEEEQSSEPYASSSTHRLVAREASAPPGPRTLVPGPRLDDPRELEAGFWSDGTPSVRRRTGDRP